MNLSSNISEKEPENPLYPEDELFVSARSSTFYCVLILLAVFGGYLWLTRELSQKLTGGWLFIFIISFLILLLVIITIFINNYSSWKFDDKGISWKRLLRKRRRILWCNLSTLSIYMGTIKFSDQNSTITFDPEFLSREQYSRTIKWICLFILNEKNMIPRIELALTNQEPEEIDKKEAVVHLLQIAAIKDMFKFKWF